VSAFDGTMSDALDAIGAYAKVRTYAEQQGLSAEEMLTAMGINGYADFEHGEDVAKDLIDEYAEWKVEQPEEPDTEAEAA